MAARLFILSNYRPIILKYETGKKMARETMEQTLMTKDSFYFSLSKICTKSIHPILPTARGNINILMILDEGKNKEKFFLRTFGNSLTQLSVLLF